MTLYDRSPFYDVTEWKKPIFVSLRTSTREEEREKRKNRGWVKKRKERGKRRKMNKEKKSEVKKKEDEWLRRRPVKGNRCRRDEGGRLKSRVEPPLRVSTHLKSEVWDVWSWWHGEDCPPNVPIVQIRTRHVTDPMKGKEEVDFSWERALGVDTVDKRTRENTQETLLVRVIDLINGVPFQSEKRWEWNTRYAQ